MSTSCLLTKKSSRFWRKAKGSMGFPVLLESAPWLGLVWASFLLIIGLSSSVLPFSSQFSCLLLIYYAFFLADRFGPYFLYIFYFFVVWLGFLLFFFLWHCLKQIKPPFGSIVRIEVCKNSDFFKKLIFLYAKVKSKNKILF